MGHSLTGDFRVLHLEEAVTKDKIRDTSKYKKYQSVHGQAQSLKNLSLSILNRTIQKGSHCSITDARAALALYRINEQEWENYVKQKNYNNVKQIVKQDAGKMARFFGAPAAARKVQKLD